jgi:hypothetical protein
MYQVPNAQLPLTVGNYYLINWDGKEYECKAYEATVLGNACVIFGNLALALDGAENTGEPFIGGNFIDLNIWGFMSEGTEHVVEIKELSVTFHKLNKDYLPDNVDNKVYYVEFITNDIFESVTTNDTVDNVFSKLNEGYTIIAKISNSGTYYKMAMMLPLVYSVHIPASNITALLFRGISDSSNTIC